MIMNSEAGVGLAFHNFGRFVETLSGKDTLHDTVGIAYQISTKNRCQGAEPEQPQPVKTVKPTKEDEHSKHLDWIWSRTAKSQRCFQVQCCLMKTKEENCTDHLLFITVVGSEVDDCICFQQRCSNVGWMEC